MFDRRASHRPTSVVIRLGESLFLGGLDKSAFPEAFGAELFFDVQAEHCERTRAVMATGRAAHSINNEPPC